MRMDAMRELCSLLEQRQDVATSAGMGVLWRQCPRPGFSLQQEQEQSCRRLLHITWRQCLAILLVARLVARSSLGSSGHDSSRQFFELVLEFLQAVATGIVIDGLTTFNREELDPYFEELIGYVAEAVEDYPFVSPDVSVVVARVIELAVAATEEEEKEEEEGVVVLSRKFDPVLKSLLSALARRCPALQASDAERVAMCLLQRWTSLGRHRSVSSASLSNGSPSSKGSALLLCRTPGSNGHNSKWSLGHEEADTDGPVETRRPQSESPNPENPTFHTPKSTPSKISPFADNGVGDSSASSEMFDGVGRKGSWVQLQTALESETVDFLERQELAFRLLGQIMLKPTSTKEKLSSQLSATARQQLNALLPLLKA